jgi:Phage integrase family
LERVVTYKGWPVGSTEREVGGAYSRAGFPTERPFHTLRHSFGACLAMTGVSLYEIAKLIGHTVEEVTELYAHLQPEHLDRQVERIPAIRTTPSPHGSNPAGKPKPHPPRRTGERVARGLLTRSGQIQ